MRILRVRGRVSLKAKVVINGGEAVLKVKDFNLYYKIEI
jgi:hypothetical protein